VLGLVLALRFLVELCLFVAVGFVGASAADALVAQVFLAGAAVVVLGVVWGLLLAPKARLSAPLQLRVVLELLLFAGVAAGLWSVGYPMLGVVLLTADVLVLAALFALGERPGKNYSPPSAAERGAA
jgi:Protein of unknown function (DUF2568)